MPVTLGKAAVATRSMVLVVVLVMSERLVVLCSLVKFALRAVA